MDVLPPEPPPLLDAEEILSMNDNVGIFVISQGDTDPGNVDLFVLKPPPDVLDLESRTTFDTSSKLCDRCTAGLEYFAYYAINRQPEEGGMARDEAPDSQAVADDSSDEESPRKPPETDDGDQAESNDDKLVAACVLHPHGKTLRDGERFGCHLCTLLARAVDIQCVEAGIPKGHVLASSIEMCWQNPWEQSGDEAASSSGQTAGMESGGRRFRVHFALTHPEFKRTTQNYENFFKLRFWPLDDYRGMFEYVPFEARQPSLLDSAKTGTNDLQPSRLNLENAPFGLVREHNTASSISKSMAMEWLSRCRADQDGKHHACNSVSSVQLPTRLLDVSSAMSTGMLRLATQDSGPHALTQRTEYVTLSHCWGEWGRENMPSLTTANLAERIDEGISVTALPRTFRDALVVADWFKVRWLWIDCLCIIQDSSADWQYEAAQMSHVYKGALLNISADSSGDARGGLFRKRAPESVTPLLLHLPGFDQTFAAAPSDKNIFEGMIMAPLSERAWVFQERQLARRVLHFTEHELIWECCAEGKHFSSETFPNGAPLATVFDNKPKFQSHGQIGKAQIYRSWNELCKLYSEKHLTYASDKLVSLSGLAKEFAILLPDDSYVAGLWRSNLPHSLLWETYENSYRSAQETYMAPSWSWASFDKPISKMSGDVNEFDDESGEAHSLVKILDIGVKPLVTSDPMSALTSASMTLSGFLRRVEVRRDDQQKPWYLLAIGGGKEHQVIFDDGEEEFNGHFAGTLEQDDTFWFTFDVEPTLVADPAMSSEKSDDPEHSFDGEEPIHNEELVDDEEAVDGEENVNEIVIIEGEYDIDNDDTLDDEAPVGDEGTVISEDGKLYASLKGYFLPISIQYPDEESEARIRGLLIEATEEVDTFRRIGTLELRGIFTLYFRYRFKRPEHEQTNIGARTQLCKALEGSWKRTGKLSIAQPSLEQPLAETIRVGNSPVSALYALDTVYDATRFDRLESRTITLV